MTVVVKDMETKEILVLTKGSDEVIFSNLDLANSSDLPIIKKHNK